MKKAKSTASTSPNTGSGLTTKGSVARKVGTGFRPSRHDQKETPSLAGGGPLSPSPLPPPHLVPPANEQTRHGRSGLSSSGLFLFFDPASAGSSSALFLALRARAPAGARSRLRPLGRAGVSCFARPSGQASSLLFPSLRFGAAAARARALAAQRADTSASCTVTHWLGRVATARPPKSLGARRALWRASHAARTRCARRLRAKQTKLAQLPSRSRHTAHRS